MSETPMSSVEQKIIQKLTEHFSPVRLEVINESRKHQGHSQHHGGVPHETGDTHFHIIMSSQSFVGMSRTERHRAVYKLLEDELNDQVHALALTLTIPH